MDKFKVKGKAPENYIYHDQEGYVQGYINEKQYTYAIVLIGKKLIEIQLTWLEAVIEDL